jgi:hypothetical protein
MAFVDHLKGAKPEGKYFETAFGLHVITGDLAKSIVTGSAPTHIVKVQHMLGNAYGKGWSAVKGLWFRGVNRDSSKYKFYPGKSTPDRVNQNFTVDHTTDKFLLNAHGYNNGDELIFVPGDLPPEILAGDIYFVVNKTTNDWQVSLTSGGSAVALTANGSGTRTVFKNDPIQGIDSVFDDDTSHSNRAWIRAECPNGSETGIPDFDTKNSPPDGLTGIFECQLGDIYDNTGAVTSADQYITNPADVLAFGCIEIRGYPTSRIDWQSIVDLRAVCNQQITPDYTTLLPQGVGLTARYYDGSAFNTLKSRRVDPVLQYDTSTGAPALDISPTAFSVRFEGKIRFKYTETYTMILTHNDGGKLWINNLSTPIIDQWGTTGEHSGTFAATADQWYDIKVEWNNAAGDSQLRLEWSSTKQRRQVVPQDRLYPKNEAKNRFEFHGAFTAPTNFDSFLRSVLFTCNGSFQDVNGKLTFFCLDETTPIFDFDESNIVKNSFSFYPRFTQQELRTLPNRFLASGRDLESRYLQEFDPPLFYDLPELQDIAGKINEETVNVGNTTRAQALANLAHHAKLQTAPLISEFEGMPQTLGILQGDKAYMTQSIAGWDRRVFLVTEATDKSIDKAADNRIFKLLDWE